MTMATQEGIPRLALVLGALALGVLSVKLSRRSSNSSAAHLAAIPSIGVPRGPFGYYIGAWNYIWNARQMTQEGYDKYPAQAFKVPLPIGWLVMISGRDMIQQFSRASDEQVSQLAAANEMMHMEHTLGREQFHDQYEVAVNGWAVPAMETFLQVVSRISNRVFIGLKCRDQEYIDITTRFTMDVFNDAFILNLVPAFLHPLVMRLFGHLDSATRKAMKHLEPIIQHRLDMDEKYGADWPEGNRPNDMLSWLIDEAGSVRRDRRTPRNLTRKLFVADLGAIHTAATAFVQALYNLAAAPEHAKALREEVEAVVRTDGWTKGAMGRMTLLDSFLKETMRFRPGAAIGVMRKVLKDFTFADGTTVPAGTFMGAPMLAEHMEEGNYEDAHKFDPYRFARMRTKEGHGTLHQMVALSPDFMVFGAGRHACPGRFFAVNEIKLMLAHVLLTYDVKLRDGVRPADEWTFTVMNANSKAEVLFRRRG
ncbi:cytochrome P450 [Mycena rebaudengoi]|nr:cytochrome P450 [Mycena rebaudengoi]